MLLLHGFLFGADWWRAQISSLRDAFDVIAVDLRGHFGSETTADGYDLWHQARDVQELIAGLGLSSVHVVGPSMGAMIAMRLALRNPAAVRSLVLMDTSARPEDPDAAERYEAMAQVVESGDLDAVAPALPTIFFADDFIAAHVDEVDSWLDRVRAADPTGFVHAMRALNARDDISARLGEITVPTLVIHGEQDVAIPMERAIELAERIDGARLELTSGGHQSNVDRPEATSRLIRDFLLEVQEEQRTAMDLP